MASHQDYSDHQKLITELNHFRTKPELLASTKYQHQRAYLTELLSTPQIFPATSPRPRLNDFLRLAHWNIEKGKYLDDVIAAFRHHPGSQCSRR